MGEECSLLVLCDGDARRAAGAGAGLQAHRRRRHRPQHRRHGRLRPDAPRGPSRRSSAIMDTAVRPLVAELRRRGIDYRGVLYAGLMLTADGPKVIEYNVRFGDPEAQVVLPLLADDAAELFLAVANGRARRGAARPTFSDDAAVCVVLASQGYPEHPRTGDTIEGLNAAGPVRRRRRRGDRLPRRHPPPQPRRAVLHGRRARARRDRGGADAGAGPRARLRRRGTDRLGGHADAPRHRRPGGRLAGRAAEGAR